MFKTEVGEIVYANLNETLIAGTMRPIDLIPVFLSALRDTKCAKKYHNIMVTNSELNAVCDELFDDLNDLAPEGYYFGAKEGDGADYGFWKN